MGLKRGDIVIAAFQGDYGKPRPAIVVETDLLAPTDHVLLAPATTFIVAEAIYRRLLVEPEPSNGLKHRSQFQLDKITVHRRDKCSQAVGRLNGLQIERMNTLITIVLGLADD